MVSPQKSHIVNNPSAQHHFTVRWILTWPLQKIKWMAILILQVVYHCIDAGYDLVRYLRYSNSVRHSFRYPNTLEALLFFYYHKIEKALSLPTVKPLFGLGYIETTISLVEQWAIQTCDFDAVVFRGAYSALVSYKKNVGQALLKARPDIYAHLERVIAEYAAPSMDLSVGGTMSICNDEPPAVYQQDYYEQLVLHRHSVRTFLEKHIPDSQIFDAVKLARHTPSVCNRQCWRVHVFTTPEDKTRILKHQNGNEGFGHQADRVLVITADLRNFCSSGERNQAFVDAGMFAMTLVLAFESQGIASCCLNMCLSAFEEEAFRKESGISVWEVPVMMMVIGYPPQRMQVAVSARKTTESMLTFRNLRQESSRQESHAPAVPFKTGG